MSAPVDQELLAGSYTDTWCEGLSSLFIVPATFHGKARQQHPGEEAFQQCWDD